MLGDFKSRVSAIGPQAGYFLPAGGQKRYLNFKGYHEFDAKNRLEGWNVWLTVAIPLGSRSEGKAVEDAQPSVPVQDLLMRRQPFEGVRI